MTNENIMNIGIRYYISLASNLNTSNQILCPAMIVIAFTSLLQHLTVAIARIKFVTSAIAEYRVSPNIYS